MGNKENLVNYTSEQSREEARINGRKGGIASGIKRRQLKAFKELLEKGLSREIKTKSGLKMSFAEHMTLRLLDKADKGDVRAFEVIRDTIGQKPLTNIETVVREGVPKIIDDVQ